MVDKVLRRKIRLICLPKKNNNNNTNKIDLVWFNIVSRILFDFADYAPK